MADIRDSYDSVAEPYSTVFAEGLGPHPRIRGALAWFAELARDVDGPVLDAGCGTGMITGYLHDLGLDAFGVDISPAMVAIARRDHPELRFDVGTMTALPFPDNSVGSVLAYYSTIHIPDAEMPAVLAGFRRVVRPGGVVMVGFHLGDGHRRKTQGYGGHPMNLDVYRRPVGRMAAWLADVGWTIEAEITEPDATAPGGVVIARRPRTAPAH